MKYVEEVEGAKGLVTNYVFPKLSVKTGTLNQFSICIGYWDKELELEFFRWFLWIKFSGAKWEETKHHREYLDAKQK
jgi:hypothetical protein